MFSDVLKFLRKEKKITQIELSEILHVSSGAIGNWESGKRQPDYATLEKLADFFGVSVDYLLGREKKADSVMDDDTSNTIKIVGRNGHKIERHLTDAQLAALKAIIDQMPDAEDNRL